MSVVDDVRVLTSHARVPLACQFFVALKMIAIMQNGGVITDHNMTPAPLPDLGEHTVKAKEKAAEKPAVEPPSTKTPAPTVPVVPHTPDAAQTET